MFLWKLQEMQNLQEIIKLVQIWFNKILTQKTILMEIGHFYEKVSIVLHHAEQPASWVNCLSFVLDLHARPEFQAHARARSRAHTHISFNRSFSSWAERGLLPEQTEFSVAVRSLESKVDPTRQAMPARPAKRASQFALLVSLLAANRILACLSAWKGWKSHEFKIRTG